MKSNKLITKIISVFAALTLMATMLAVPTLANVTAGSIINYCGDATNITPGGFIQLGINASDSDNALHVEWSISGNTSADTYVAPENESNTLVDVNVGDDETAKYITVTCTCGSYVSKDEKSDTLTLYIAAEEEHVHTLVATSGKPNMCTEDGNKPYYTCTVCGKYFSDAEATTEIEKDSWILPALGHVLTKIEAKAATTTETGNTEYYICDRCHKYFSDNAGNNEIEKDSWVIPTTECVEMHRLYNPNTGEHFYTASVDELNSLTPLGWQYEGVAWNAPVTSDTPVYRLYNPYSGDHHYTTNKGEKDWLVGLGWVYECIAWYSAGETPIYRLYNPNAVTATHHYTGFADERDWLVTLGWIDEGIAWYSE